ncbi:hypothetical protein GCM10011607_12270 [Shewanella inventionis]|uniref:Zinc finger CHC2-type domain-containing protein n=1 Tax=Shewanella inventionis TaxID=1738770 RepID=A0ABQ1IX76_9GAMM|nr:CHC2 zinc finger domain-containing protein [Shewanella inventionis]GGB53280.1 hypothetical protein GCM10011607_12270 [Shewanella inventionis]
MISKSFIDKLKQTVSIVELIDSYVPLKKQGKEYVACCPFHTESSPSFKVNENKDLFHCFGCGEHGGIIDFVMEYESIGFGDAVEVIAGKFGLTVEYEHKSKANKKPSDSEVSLVKFVQKVFERNTNTHTINEMFKSDTIAELGLTCATNNLSLQETIRANEALKKLASRINFHSGYLKNPSDNNALVVPLYKQNKQFVGLYVNSKNEPYVIGQKNADKGLLYNPCNTTTKGEPIIISNDMIDVIKCHEMGIPNCMCAADTNAKTLTNEMLRTYRSQRTYYIVKNTPDDTKRLAMELLSSIKTSNNVIGLNVLIINEKISLNAMVAANGKGVIPAVLSKANTWHDFIARELTKGRNTYDDEFKVEMSQLLLDTFEQSTKHKDMPLLLHLIAESIGKCSTLNAHQIFQPTAHNVSAYIDRKLEIAENQLMEKHIAYSQRVINGIPIQHVDTLTALLLLESKGVTKPILTDSISSSLASAFGEESSFAKVLNVINEQGYISQMDIKATLGEVESFQVNSCLQDFMLDDGFLIDAKIIVDDICRKKGLTVVGGPKSSMQI